MLDEVAFTLAHGRVPLNQTTSVLSDARRAFHAGLLGSGLLRANAQGVPSNADSGSVLSVAIAQALMEKLGESAEGVRMDAQTAGAGFENLALAFLKTTFLSIGAVRCGSFEVRRNEAISKFDQYEHLAKIALAAKSNDELRVALGMDYLIVPDVVVIRHPDEDEIINSRERLVDEGVALRSPLRQSNERAPSLHASLSCKWTLRSDRAQNARSEALNLIRNRKGRLPHIAVLTAEPTPGRIASLALGTGDIDCVYHVALDELIESVAEVGNARANQTLSLMVAGRRLRDLSDLPLDLAI